MSETRAESTRLRDQESPLRASTAPIASLDDSVVDEMWKLFDRYYVEVKRASFERDLSNKDHVILLRDGSSGTLKGFSTLAAYFLELDGRPFQVIFSGDTVIDRAYWGQTALQRAFLSFVIRRKLSHPLTPTYWFLITKGYKTYLLLARNFPEHWPRYDRSLPEVEARRIALLASQRFGSAWQPDRGVLVFDRSVGRLRDDAAPVDARALSLPEVRFFLERNPNHAQGEELCCIGRIDSGLWVSYLSKLARRALDRRLP
ncbi:MAG: hypothetical protein HY791_40445 [Deltaproteobacteria bacterium]|nr:hypothetical protein [Deltaproteobacteria bacterium]